MIRRAEGDQFWLIRQDAHARLAGEIAAHFGNSHFARPKPRDETLLGIASHDDGWPLHDDTPQLSDAGHPLDVFEAPRSVTHPVWLASARRAAERDAYAGLLVSLHQLSLSAMSFSANTPAKFDVQQMRNQFEVNKFQHAVIELLEGLRSQLGLRTDRPLRLGLADGWTDEAEEQLRFNFRLLQAMDGLSLAICCNDLPAQAASPLHARPSGGTVQFQVHRPMRELMLVKPWPFDVPELALGVPYCAVPARAYLDPADLHSVLQRAPAQEFQVVLRPA